MRGSAKWKILTFVVLFEGNWTVSRWRSARSLIMWRSGKRCWLLLAALIHSCRPRFSTDFRSWALFSAATGGLPANDDGISLQELSDRACGIFDKVVRNIKKCEVTENTEKIWAATMGDVEEGVTVGPMFYSRDDVS